MQTGRVASGTMSSAVVPEHEPCAMEVGASTLGAGMRANLTFGCAMGDTTFGDVGRLKLTFLGVCSTLGDLGGLGVLAAEDKGAWGWGAVVDLPDGLIGGWKGC